MASEILITIHQSSWVCSLQGNLKNSWNRICRAPCGDVKTIKSGKISSIGSDISEKQSIVYTSACIEEARIGRSLSHTNIKDGSNSHSWNDEYHAFGYQLDQWGVDSLFQNLDEEITREFKLYIEEWEICISRARYKYQKPCLL